ncbi:MAG: EVE domain-containing protein [Gemmatimonadota bacterium]
MAQKRHWLMKSEEDAYSIDDLKRDGKAPWTGVRNYEARNLMRDQMSPGDLMLYYHSNTSPPGVVGIAEVASEPYPDPTQFDEEHTYHDPRSSEDDPRWWLVDVAFVEKLPRKVPLAEIKSRPDLSKMVLVKRARLSVQPVEAREFEMVRAMAREG